MIRGADLARGYHADVVAPLLARRVPGLGYAAGRLGSGSDVLGLDDAMSMDHDFGLRLTLLVDERDRDALPIMVEALDGELPHEYAGWPVRFNTSWRPVAAHQIEIATVGDFAASRLGVDPTKGLSTLDWLTLVGQSVLEVTAGPVFVDSTSELSRVREALRWYQPDLGRYVLAAGWQRVCQYLPVVGRTAERGDELGSRLLAASLATDLIRLAFLTHRRWPPYRKWLGVQLRTLPHADEFINALAAVSAETWREREHGLVAAADQLLGWQRASGVLTTDAGVIPFWDRPYLTIAPAVPESLLGKITDPDVARLPAGIGSIEQWVDSVDVLSRPARRVEVTRAYRAWMVAADTDRTALT